jgi:hypothetical protein
MSAHPVTVNSPTAGVPQAVVDRALLNMARKAGDSCMHLGAVLLFDGDPPNLDTLTTHLTERLPFTPELTFHVGGTARRPRWEPDPAFDIRNHVHQANPIPGPGPFADRVLNAMLGLPLDPRHPLWGLWLIPTDRSYALCYRAHHGFQDGQAVARTLRTLFAPAPPHTVDRFTTPPRPPLRPGVIKDMLPLLRRTSHWSALDTPPGPRRLAMTADTDLARIKAIARATDSTINQVCLAAVTAVLRARFPHDWPDPSQALRTTMGVSLRAPRIRYPRLGNCVGGCHVTLPCGEPSSLRRLQILRDQLTPEHLAQVRRHQAALFQRMPQWCGTLFAYMSLDSRFVPLTVADVRGRAGAITFGGAPARAVYALPIWPPRQPLTIAWITHLDQLTTTFVAHDGLPGRDPLPDLWRWSIDDLEASTGTE